MHISPSKFKVTNLHTEPLNVSVSMLISYKTTYESWSYDGIENIDEMKIG